jgi:hypothetical protein
MTSLGFVRLFSSPSTAFVISAILVAGFGVLFFRIGRGKQAASADIYWKRLGLAAEICVAVGLVGLATFAGRMKIGADHQMLEYRVAMTQSAVDERLRVVILENCPAAGKRALAPFNPAVAKKELCAIARSYAGETGRAADWELAERSLADFGRRYPGCIPNVFTSHSDCGGTVVAANKLAAEIAALEDSKLAARSDEAMSAWLQNPNSWEFLLLAFIVAAIGVAIKCARAAAAVWESAR